MTHLDEIDEELSKRFRQLVGSVMYLILGTRPDISFAVSLLSRHMSGIGVEQWQAAIRLLRYLKGTEHYTIHLGHVSHDTEILPVVYSDADWAQDKNDRRSTTGYIFQLNGSNISWQTRKQKTLEAEYMALSATTKEAIWMQKFVSEIGVACY